MPRDIEDVTGLSADARRLYDWMIAAFTGDVNEALALAQQHGTSLSKWTTERLREAHVELKDRGVLAADAPDLKGSRHHAKKKSPGQLDQEIAEALSRRRSSSAHATKSARADELITSYQPWTSSYSNEDLDRVSSLASRLTDIDRQESRPAPPVGFSKERYAQAKQVVEDTNRYGKKQQSLRAAGRTHARKKKISPQEAKRLIESDGIDFRRDFHELSSSEVQRVLEVARLAGYRKRKGAPGSTARMYFQYLSRLQPGAHDL
jgi:hypothetical protein